MIKNISKLNKQMNFQLIKRNITLSSICSKIFGTVDKESINHKIGHSPLTAPLENCPTEFLIPSSDKKIQMSKLSNGITVVTETPDIPTDINIGILLNLGTRDEDDKTSGSLLSFKNTYYKSILNTNETINFGMVQMSGGKYNMEYNQENTYYSARCISHDVYDIFEMMADCVFEPKNTITANVAIEKNQYSHNKENQFNSGEEYSHNLMKAAFGNSKISNSLLGKSSNIINLDSSTLQKFQIENLSPEKVIIGATGVFNHNEFKDIVSDKLGHLIKVDTNKRDVTNYIGGEFRMPNDSYTSEMSICFKGSSWSEKNLIPFKLLTLLYGEADQENIKESGDTTGKFESEVFSKYSFVDSLSLINLNFTDSGIFGIKIKGDCNKNTELLNIAIEQLKGLKNITQSELNMAKKSFKLKYLKGVNSNENRLEEILKNFGTYEKFYMNDLMNKIDSLTLQDMKSAVDSLFKSNITLVAEGGNLNIIPSTDTLKSKFK